MKRKPAAANSCSPRSSSAPSSKKVASSEAAPSGESSAAKVKDSDQIAFHFHLLSGEVISATLAELQKMEGDYYFGQSREKKQERPPAKGVVFPIRVDDLRIGCAMLLTQRRRESQGGVSKETTSNEAPIFPSSLQFFAEVEQEVDAEPLADDSMIMDDESSDRTRSLRVVAAEFSEAHVQLLYGLLTGSEKSFRPSPLPDSEISEYIKRCHAISPGKELVPLETLDLPPELRAMWKFSKKWVVNPEDERRNFWGDSLDSAYAQKEILVEDAEESGDWKEEEGLQQSNIFVGLASAEWLVFGGNLEDGGFQEYYVYIRKDRSVDAEPYQPDNIQHQPGSRRGSLLHVPARFGEVREHTTNDAGVSRTTKGPFRRFVYYLEHQRRAFLRYGEGPVRHGGVPVRFSSGVHDCAVLF